MADCCYTVTDGTDGGRVMQLIESLRDALRLARKKETELRELIAQLEKHIGLLEEESPLLTNAPAPPEAVKPTTPEENLRAIMDILRKNGNSMRRSEIAKKAVDLGLIVSKSGPSGVDPIVGNILSRNEPRLFINTGWGWWDLAERHKKQERSAPSSPTNQPEPIRFPRLASNS